MVVFFAHSKVGKHEESRNKNALKPLLGNCGLLTRSAIKRGYPNLSSVQLVWIGLVCLVWAVLLGGPTLSRAKVWRLRQQVS